MRIVTIQKPVVDLKATGAQIKLPRAIPELEDDRNCIIRDEAASIADSCIRLMTHPSERNAIAQAGYDLVNNHYGWEEKLKNYVTEH